MSFKEVVGFLLNLQLIVNKNIKIKLDPSDEESINPNTRVRDFSSMPNLRFYIVDTPKKANRPKMKSEQEISMRRVEKWMDKGPMDPGCCHRNGECAMF